METYPRPDYTDLQPTIGWRLRTTRERRTGLDQEEFADLINVSRGTVSNYERDRMPGGPRQRLVLTAWALACGVTRTWLETGETPAQPELDEGDWRARRYSKPQPSDPKVRGPYVRQGRRYFIA